MKILILAVFLSASACFAAGEKVLTDTTSSGVSAVTISRSGNRVTELHSIIIDFEASVTNQALVYINDSTSTNLVADSGTLTNQTSFITFNAPLFLKDGDIIRIVNSYTAAEADIRHSVSEK